MGHSMWYHVIVTNSLSYCSSITYLCFQWTASISTFRLPVTELRNDSIALVLHVQGLAPCKDDSSCFATSKIKFGVVILAALVSMFSFVA
jgi:hypothetical protein